MRNIAFTTVHPFLVSVEGEEWRPVLPGRYKKYSKKCYILKKYFFPKKFAFCAVPLRRIFLCRYHGMIGIVPVGEAVTKIMQAIRCEERKGELASTLTPPPPPTPPPLLPFIYPLSLHYSPLYPNFSV